MSFFETLVGGKILGDLIEDSKNDRRRDKRKVDSQKRRDSEARSRSAAEKQYLESVFTDFNYVAPEDFNRYDEICERIQKIVRCERQAEFTSLTDDDFMFLEAYCKRVQAVRKDPNNDYLRMILMDMTLLIQEKCSNLLTIMGGLDIGHWQVNYFKEKRTGRFESVFTKHLSKLYDAEFFYYEQNYSSAIIAYYDFLNWGVLLEDSYRELYDKREIYPLCYSVVMNIMTIYRLFGYKEKAEEIKRVFDGQIRAFIGDCEQYSSSLRKRGLPTEYYDEYLSKYVLCTDPIMPIKKDCFDYKQDECGYFFKLADAQYFSENDITDPGYWPFIKENLILTEDSVVWMFSVMTLDGLDRLSLTYAEDNEQEEMLLVRDQDNYYDYKHETDEYQEIIRKEVDLEKRIIGALPAQKQNDILEKQLKLNYDLRKKLLELKWEKEKVLYDLCISDSAEELYDYTDASEEDAQYKEFLDHAENAKEIVSELLDIEGEFNEILITEGAEEEEVKMMEDFLVSVIIGYLESFGFTRDFAQTNLNLLLTHIFTDHTYNTDIIMDSIENPEMAEYDTWYGLANAWDSPSNVYWPFFIAMCVTSFREELAYRYCLEIARFLYEIGQMLQPFIPGIDVDVMAQRYLDHVSESVMPYIWEHYPEIAEEMENLLSE